jgi:class 3 adenylate cyclase
MAAKKKTTKKKATKKKRAKAASKNCATEPYHKHFGSEWARLESYLRARGTAPEGNIEIEREMFERYQDDCAVLVLDSSGFTRITKKHGIIHFLSLVVAMRDIVREIFDRHEAISHWPHCDNMFGVFPSAKLAVQSAVAIQRAVAVENATRPEASRLEVCVAVGKGRLLRIGCEDIYGDEMNVASKLGEDVAEKGEILLSEAAHAEIENQADGLKAEEFETRVSGVTIPYYRLDYSTDLVWS